MDRPLVTNFVVPPPQCFRDKNLSLKAGSYMKPSVLDPDGKNFFIWFGSVPRVHIKEPELIREILNKYQIFQKPKPNPLMKLFVDGLASHEEEKWAKHRKIINPAFHVEKLKSFTNFAAPLIIPSSTASSTVLYISTPPYNPPSLTLTLIESQSTSPLHKIQSSLVFSPVSPYKSD
ncbi:hypothetical protein LguiB_002066 [Lonicera macranthoides]